ncbi:hypothetical protein [Streptacidiphilus cavernicola]|uniref:Uncharacterized protein n=1 Tax=Streptacidiphilus cavernicola TaxID=3342716 RepID=A0ABV6W477_9ACTN
MFATTPEAPFDADVANKAIGAALVNLVKLMLPAPGQGPDPELAETLMPALTGALTAGSAAVAEVRRVREAVATMRDGHRPRPHADTTAPGALCESCSLHGALIPWPCAAWTSAEQILAHSRT